MEVTGAEEDWNSTEVLISREGGGRGGGKFIFAELREKSKGESLL